MVGVESWRRVLAGVVEAAVEPKSPSGSQRLGLVDWAPEQAYPHSEARRGGESEVSRIVVVSAVLCCRGRCGAVLASAGELERMDAWTCGRGAWDGTGRSGSRRREAQSRGFYTGTAGAIYMHSTRQSTWMKD